MPWLLLAVGFAFPGLLLLNTERTGEDVTLDVFRGELLKRSTEGASDCGEIYLPRVGAPAAPTDCLHQALTSGSAFRIAFAWDGFGHGYETWFGYGRGADGRVWQVVYSADKYEGHREEAVPVINVWSCPGFAVPESFHAPLFC